MRTIIPIAGLLLMLTVVFAFTRSDIPEIDYDYEPVGEAVTLNFRVHKFNPNGVEIALNNPRTRTFFIQFDVGMEGLSPVVTMTGLSNGSRLKGTASPRNLPDFPFLRDKAGNPVMNFAFVNQFATDLQGNQAMRMSYEGVPVPLVETLVIDKPIMLPAALSKQFGGQGLIEFQPGTLYLDVESQPPSFWIPVRTIKGR